MIKSLLMSAVLALAVTSNANAAMVAAPLGADDSAIVRVAQGCGPGYYRGPAGYCRHMRGPYMAPAYRPYMCPPGMHRGRYDRRCLPNR